MLENHIYKTQFHIRVCIYIYIHARILSQAQDLKLCFAYVKYLYFLKRHTNIMQIFLVPVRCQILNNLLENVKKEENSSCALPIAFSTILCEFPQKKDFFVYKNYVAAGGAVERE